MRTKQIRAILYGLGCSLLAMQAAHAMNGPASIEIDGGPLGPLQLSGGVDGYAYAETGTGNASILGQASHDNGVNLDTALVQLQKTTGILQFNLEIGPYGGMPTLGAPPQKATVNFFRASPFYLGYLTIAPPDSPVTISVGQLPGLEGYEGLTWGNANLFATDIFFVENAPSVGVSVNYQHGPVSVTVTFGDGWDTRVFNFVQALATYTINPTNNVDVFYGGNMGKTGLNAITYNQTPVGAFGAYYMNSQMFGAWYSYTRGNLGVVPEVQYVYAKVDHAVGIDKFTSNLGAAIFADYGFGSSPYSLGGMVEYFTSNGPSDWFIAPHAEGVGFEVTPTWQYKNLFARASAGYIHLLNGGAYGNDGNGTNTFQSGLQGGILF
jgi:hypothetical protein